MKVTGERTIDADREVVWEALLDPEILAGTLPGFQRLDEVGPHEFAGALALGVGPVQGRFEGRVALSDLIPPSSYALKMEGRGGPGFVEGEGTVELEAEGERTVLRFDVDVQVGGRIAGVGQRLLDMTSRMLTKQALDRLAAAIEARASG